MGKNRNAFRILLGKNAKERDSFEYFGICGRILLKWSFRHLDWGEGWTEFFWLCVGTGGGPL
jgi:hypothetical protein